MSMVDISQVVIRVPAADDADRWDAFIVAEQAKVYAGLVPDNFAQRQLAGRDANARDADFDSPGTTKRLIAEFGGELIGVAESCDAPADWERWLGLADDAPAERELGQLYVSEHAKGTGLASRLMEAVLGSDAAYLWIIDGNDRAHRFYLKHGFVDFGESVPAGQTWGGTPMHRMVRPAAGAARAN